ncbi:cell division protein Fic [Bifidobacterium sp. UTCIF-37]|uniref:Fic family protein n=1 Tax=unclassified Bifidobacterium TaxID=2608897 RepID=UPI001125C96F|nr:MULTISPECIES: Fic family protein [unclassified Bifidobacterium]TPF86469.1 cell division protein Fic [Bifidobacterium sp. UTCIF-37]TPF89419.1 cell division protein Fic [Bifidobacterium sp. UTCIF-38]
MKRIRLVEWLRRERDQRVDGGLYYNTQILFAYNSNHMEGSTLSPEQTAQLYSTGALLPDGSDDQIRADDVVETRNHFHAFNWILDHVDDPVDRTMVCTLHAILKRGTSQELDLDRNVGGYKVVPNVISEILGVHTALPADVPQAMEQVFTLYRNLRDDPYEIAHAHWMFETTHPFSDGNGRIGRLIMFKELLRLNTVPLIVRDSDKNLYVRGLSRFGEEPGYLVDTLLTERDYYEGLIERLAPDRIRYSYVSEWDPDAVAERRGGRRISNPFVKRNWPEDDMRSRVNPHPSVSH